MDKGYRSKRLKLNPRVRGLQPEEALAAAVIQQAIKEYRSLFRRRQPEYIELEHFFRSGWFGILSLGMIDPEELIRDLRGR